MNRDMVSVINQLTSSEKLAGYDMLKRILINHYNTFILFYNHLKTLSINIEDLYCQETENNLILYIKTNEVDNNDIYNHFLSMSNKNFNITVINKDDLIILDIFERRRLKK